MILGEASIYLFGSLSDTLQVLILSNSGSGVEILCA